MDRAELDSVIATYLPDSFLERALRAVFAAHQMSHDAVRQEFEPTEAENVLPYYKRGKVEELVRAAARRSTMDTSVVRSTGSNWNHTEIRNGPVVMTISAVQAPCGMVESSDFRTSLAQPNPEFLWDEPTDEVPDGSTPLYALLLHSRSQWLNENERRRYGMLPGSLYVAFPARGLDSYIHSINLFDKFPSVIESLMPPDWSEQTKLRYIYQSRRSMLG